MKIVLTTKAKRTYIVVSTSGAEVGRYSTKQAADKIAKEIGGQVRWCKTYEFKL